ncbi:UbiA prenyltransferase family-domain-containing protein [Hypoxylon sp. FL1284]|nr:UbiA prenyltransferase family-domain-containing protein [Hypoxylon sp. FL1284]
MITTSKRSSLYSESTLFEVIDRTRDNIKDIICMGFLFGALNAYIAPTYSMGAALSARQILSSSPKMLLWSWSNLFLFNIHNQRHDSSVKEDAVNKPWRPLPAGRITPRQTTLLVYAMYPVIILVSLQAGGMASCIFEAFLCLWYNEFGGAADPLFKNLLNGLGFGCFFAGPFEVATGHSILSGNSKATAWLAILAACITTISHTQDFRDMEGDRTAGRKTVPLIIGDTPARVVVLLGVVGWTAASCWYWEAGLVESLMAWVTGGVMVGNLFLDRSQAGDSFSWKLCPAWLLGLLSMPVLCEMS